MNLVRSWPQGQAGPTPLGWRLPQPLMPPRVNGWPMGVVPSSDAEALLESAVAWWDASRYREGDRFLRNQGIAGELLDLRLGSSVAPNSNDPTWLGVQDSGYAYLPGVVGNYLSVPDEAALDITGDIDIRVWVALDDWTPGSFNVLLGKFGSAGQRSYRASIETNGTMSFEWSPDGTTIITKLSTVATGIADGSRSWVRVTLDVDNGASGSDVKFYTSIDGITWSQLGSTVTTAGTTSIFASTSGVQMPTSSNTLVGKFYRAQVLNGIDGTTVLDVDCNAITSGSQTSFQALTGQTVTVNRSTSGRKSVAQPGRGTGRANFLLGTDDYFEIPADRVWQHQLLNFGQADSFTVVMVTRGFGTGGSAPLVIKSESLTGAAAGFSVYANYGTFGLVLYVKDGANTSFDQTNAGSSGAVAVYVGVRNTGVDSLSAYVNGVVPSPTVDTTNGSLATTSVLRLGRSGSLYADMEFTAAAVFRRALTAAEITAITRYYGAS